MSQNQSRTQNIRSYPVQRRLSWWPDWEFTNDLLLSPQRPLLSDVTITAAADPLSFETVVNIECQVKNLTDQNLQHVQIHAVIIDEFGIIITRPETRLWTQLENLAAHREQPAQLAWQQEHPAASYHLLLRLEDEHGDLLDVVSGDFVVG